MSGELYSVVQFFPDDSYERAGEGLDAESAVKMARALTLTVGAKIGTTRRVIITDDGDACCFEWQHGKGVTWPPESAGRV